MAHWIRTDLIHPLKDIGKGLEQMPNALINLYKGTDGGSRMVRIDAKVDS